ncbi:zinc-binding dehydrogenase family oxidoreductase (macronuclear) [Tetrahymena thermophila SB210]|uniref:Zinc-binding dehydrogenase family oxidoreductase n=1 Tax=Tetrahymena thermophila (strain SB210) TaxID=312017 RepID=I7M997_TETTS|nr:zinc-binding dehydrogenase family oxidoreductase [Tetrahymena thermophila SB210]EAS01170.1 zinc-binding dehydrogenase family oxidoreductase [Tetrahymena thermophila SB210]|eukprot:XP_001021415.1 zinc-binding dehydrogenase family oxidoreductase [Tetrahymena thermophila SB210]
MNHKQMQCLILEQYGKPLVLKSVDIPQPTEGEVLIQVEAAPINPSDLLFIEGQHSNPSKQPPCIPGFEGSGIIVKSGGGELADSLINKRVAFYRSKGSFAQYTVSKAEWCLVFDKQITFNQAASSFINPLTVINMLEIVKEAKVKAIVNSAASSALGRMIVRYFKKNGIDVINIVRRPEQIDILKQEGATYILNQNDKDFLNQLNKITNQLNATIFFDAVAGSFTGEVLTQMPIYSTAYVYGFLSGKNFSIPTYEFIYNKQNIQGFSITSRLLTLSPEKRKKQLEIVQEFIQTDFKTDIANEFPIKNIEKAINYYSQNMSEGKVLLKPQL